MIVYIYIYMYTYIHTHVRSLRAAGDGGHRVRAGRRRLQLLRGVLGGVAVLQAHLRYAVR